MQDMIREDLMLLRIHIRAPSTTRELKDSICDSNYTQRVPEMQSENLKVIEDILG